MDKLYQKSSGGAKNAGFTLIELLVVVLIIGVLTAVVLPQYQYAVNKARFQQMLPLVEGMFKAQTVYYMANGEYASDLGLLDVSLPSDFTLSGDSAQNKMMSCTVVHNFNQRVYCVLRKSPGVAYIRWFKPDRRACVVFTSSNQEQQEFCKKFTGKNTYETYGAWSIYYIDN